MRFNSENGLRLATEQGFAGFQALCTVARGWARAVRDVSPDAIREIQQGMEQVRATGNAFAQPLFDCMLGEALLLAGRVAEALKSVVAAQEEIDKQGEPLIYDDPVIQDVAPRVMTR